MNCFARLGKSRKASNASGSIKSSQTVGQTTISAAILLNIIRKRNTDQSCFGRFDIDVPAECGKTDKRSQKMPSCDTFPPVPTKRCAVVSSGLRHEAEQTDRRYLGAGGRLAQSEWLRAALRTGKA